MLLFGNAGDFILHFKSPDSLRVENPQLDSAAIRAVLDRIGNQVIHHLVQPLRVSPYFSGRFAIQHHQAVLRNSQPKLALNTVSQKILNVD
jgi:hypothetical protein